MTAQSGLSSRLAFAKVEAEERSARRHAHDLRQQRRRSARRTFFAKH